jgi:hypothetical protein
LGIRHVDFRTVARQSRTVVFGHIWKTFFAEGCGDEETSKGDLGDALLCLSTPEIFATTAFVLMTLGSPFFTRFQAIGGSFHPIWTTDRTHELLESIYQAAQALLSEERLHADIIQRFFNAQATIVLTQIPDAGRTTKYVRSFHEGDLALPNSLQSLIHQALEEDDLPPTSN